MAKLILNDALLTALETKLATLNLQTQKNSPASKKSMQTPTRQSIPADQLIEPTKKKAEQQKPDLQKYLATIRTVHQWLSDTYPDVFNLQSPKPLKRHIEKDLFNQLPEHITRTQMRRGLQAWTNQMAYLNAIIDQPERYDLTGNVVEKVAESQKEYSRQRQQFKQQKFDERQALRQQRNAQWEKKKHFFKSKISSDQTSEPMTSPNSEAQSIE